MPIEAILEPIGTLFGSFGRVAERSGEAFENVRREGLEDVGETGEGLKGLGASFGRCRTV